MAHFYLPDGQPFYEVPYAGKREGTRPAHIGDARKVGAFPSVTAIIDVPRKPALENWKVEQAILAALTNPDIKPDMPIKEIMALIKRDSMRQAKEAADQGTAIHDAIEAFMRDRDRALKALTLIRPGVIPTVTAVGDMLDEMCGPQEWEAEKWFAHPLGFGGKIDLISDEWVIDFKTKPGEASGHQMYDDQLMQLVAYDMGCPTVDFGDGAIVTRYGYAFPPRKKANVIVSRDIPGSVAWWSWDGADEEKAWDEFCLLLQYWQSRNNYWPHLERAA